VGLRGTHAALIPLLALALLPPMRGSLSSSVTVHDGSFSREK
jgi:hypothetical protein